LVSLPLPNLGRCRQCTQGRFSLPPLDSVFLPTLAQSECFLIFPSHNPVSSGCFAPTVDLLLPVRAKCFFSRTGACGQGAIRAGVPLQQQVPGQFLRALLASPCVHLVFLLPALIFLVRIRPPVLCSFVASLLPSIGLLDSEKGVRFWVMPVLICSYCDVEWLQVKPRSYS
jgi:hypothetical protein